MAAVPQLPLRREIPVLPAKRLLALDPGSHSLKLLLVEEIFGRFRILRHEVLELHSEGRGADDDFYRHVRTAIGGMGDDPIALALPHYRALSQVVDLPSSEPADVKRAIEEETLKLSGLGESHIVYDYATLQPFGKHENPFWVTLCQEDEIQRQIARCGLAQLDLCEVTTSANGLIAAFQAVSPETDRVVLVEFGAAGTLVAILAGGQPVYTSTFPLGGDTLTDALAAQRNCSTEAAEELKRAPEILQGPAASGLEGPLKKWLVELQRILNEWVREHSDLKLPLESFRIILCGGVSLQPGVRDYLNGQGPLRFEPWPELPGSDWPGVRFASAYGTALHALGKSRQPASLLPDEVRVYWNRHHSLQVLHSLLVFLLGLLALALGLGIWQKLNLLSEKQALIEQSRTALEKARTTEVLSRQLGQHYDRLRPVLQRQRETLDTLRTLASLQQIRTNQSFWLVLFADQHSYLKAQPFGATNLVALTNLVASVTAAPPKEGFIAELCVPEQGDAKRRILSQVVAGLKRSKTFRNVDSLADDRRRALVDPKVLVPDSHFAIEMETAENPFGRPEAGGERRGSGTVGLEAKPPLKPAGNGLERRLTIPAGPGL